MLGNLKAAASSATSNNGGVLSKIKNDFESSGITGLTGGTGTGGGGASLALDGVTRCITLPIPLANMPIASEASGGRVILPATTSNGLLDVISSLKDLALVSFESIIREREEMIKRGEAAMAAERARTSALEGAGPAPGVATSVSWRFERFFLMKETLACTFEAVGLLEDALRIYDELEAALVQVVRQDAGPPLRLGLEEFQRDAGPLLSSDADMLRTRRSISTGNATVYDFRCYLFRRQVSLLGEAVPLGFGSGRAQAALALRRGVAFIVGMGQWLRDRELSSATSAFTIEAWTYDAAQSLVEACARWVQQGGDAAKTAKDGEEISTRAYHRLRGELLAIALSQLDRVGVLSGYLPPTYPFVLASFSAPKKNAVLFEGPGMSPGSSSFAANDGRLPATPHAPTPTQRPVSPGLARSLIQAARSEAAFFEQYDRALQMTIESEDKGGRFRERQMLTEKQAGLAFHQGQFGHARELYVRLLHEYLADESHRVDGDASWLQLRQHAFVMMLDCRDRLQLPPDRETILLGLEHLKTSCRVAPTGDDPITKRIMATWSGLRDDTATRGFNVLDHPVFSVRLVSSSAESLEDEDGWRCTAEVTSRLSESLACDDVRLAFAGNGIEHVWCTAGAITLQPGVNRVQLTCLTPLSGMYRLQSSLVLCGKLVFEHDWTAHTDDLRVLQRRLLRIPPDPRVLRAELRVPRRIALDQEPTLELVIETRRNDVVGMTVALGAPGETVAFRHEGAASDDVNVSASPKGVKMGSLRPDTSTVLIIPYAHLNRTDPLHARISIDYATVSAPTRLRKYRSAQTLHLALPLAVNVQDFFRPDRIISRFTASSPGRHVLRIGEATLRPDATTSARLQVTPFRAVPQVEDVTPESPVSFLFLIKREQEGERGSPDRVRLSVLYRTIEEELRFVLMHEVERRLAAGQDAAPAVSHLIHLYTEQSNRDPRLVQNYLETGRLQLTSDSGDPLIDDVLEHVAATRTTPASLPWRTLEIPVDIPIMQLVCASRLVFPSDASALRVGQALDVRLEVESSWAWSGKSRERHEVVWELVVDEDCWVVGGAKAGEVVCDVSVRSAD